MYIQLKMLNIILLRRRHCHYSSCLIGDHQTNSRIVDLTLALKLRKVKLAHMIKNNEILAYREQIDHMFPQ